MFLHTNEVNYLGEYRLRFWFNNGQIKDVDLRDELQGEVFQPLNNLELFQQAQVDPDTGTVEWPNGPDLVV